MANQEALHAALVDFATRLTYRYDLDEVLNDVSSRAAEVLELDGAGLTIGPDPANGDMRFVTATDEITTSVERKQDEFHEGVCFEAAKRGEVVLVSALAATDMWPRFTPVALEAGFQSAAGIPMATDGELIGVLNAYRRSTGSWSNEDVSAGQLLARIATTYITNVSRLDEARKLADQLQEALDSRVVIEQAKGVLSERLRIDPDVAFGLLRAYARSNRRPLRYVSQQLLAGEINIGQQN